MYVAVIFLLRNICPTCFPKCKLAYMLFLCVDTPSSLLSGWTLCVLGKGHRYRPAHRSRQPRGKGPASVFPCCQHPRHGHLQDWSHGLWYKNEGNPKEDISYFGLKKIKIKNHLVEHTQFRHGISRMRGYYKKSAVTECCCFFNPLVTAWLSGRWRCDDL